MKMFEKNGNLVSKSNAGSTMTNKAQKEIFELVTKQSVELIRNKATGLPRLQEIKDFGKQLQNNPWNLELSKGHANAKVRFWCQRLVSKGTKVQIKDKVQLERIEALEFGNAVIFVNLAAIRREIAAEKNPKVQEDMKKKLATIIDLPKRESYY